MHVYKCRRLHRCHHNIDFSIGIIIRCTRCLGSLQSQWRAVYRVSSALAGSGSNSTIWDCCVPYFVPSMYLPIPVLIMIRVCLLILNTARYDPGELKLMYCLTTYTFKALASTGTYAHTLISCIQQAGFGRVWRCHMISTEDWAKKPAIRIATIIVKLWHHEHRRGTRVE